MKIDVNVNIHLDQREAPRWAQTIREMVSQVLTNQETIMEELAELKAVLATIMETVGHVSADTDNLLAKLAAIPTGDLPDDVKNAITDSLTAAKAIAERLTGIDNKVADQPAV